jgi:hypothetical protein
MEELDLAHIDISSVGVNVYMPMYLDKYVVCVYWIEWISMLSEHIHLFNCK